MKQRWGDTDAYKESARRTKQYTPADWARIKAKIETVEADYRAKLEASEA